MYLHSATSPPLPTTMARIESGELPRHDVLQILGAPVGREGPEYNAVLQQRVDRQDTVFHRLVHDDMPMQVAFLLLRSCVQFQFDYLLRMVAPNLVEEFAAKFDRKLFKYTAEILNLEFSATNPIAAEHKAAIHQLRLPLSKGGCGLRKTMDIRHIAYLAAHVGVVRDDPTGWTAISDQHRNTSAKVLHDITECVTRARELILGVIPGDGIPNPSEFHARQTAALENVLVSLKDGTTAINFADFLEFYEKGGEHDDPGMIHLQTTLTRLATKSRTFAFRHSESALINAMSSPVKRAYHAHLTSISNPLANRWLQVIPSQSKLQMANATFESAMRTLMHLPARAKPLIHCPCEKAGDTGKYLTDPLHGLSCRWNGRQTIGRHNQVVDALALGLRRCGATPVVEPAGYDAETDRQPDIFVILNGEPTFIDVGIVHASAPSHQHYKPLGAADAYGNLKRRKYEQTAMDNDATFKPFILETSGAYGNSAKALVGDILELATTSALAFSPEEIVDDLLDSVAIAIQIGNFMATTRARERSIQDCFRNHYRPSVAQQTLMMQERSRSNQSSAHASVPAPPPPPARVSASAIRSLPQAIVDVDAPEPDGIEVDYDFDTPDIEVRSLTLVDPQVG